HLSGVGRRYRRNSALGVVCRARPIQAGRCRAGLRRVTAEWISHLGDTAHVVIARESIVVAGGVHRSGADGAAEIVEVLVPDLPIRAIDLTAELYIKAAGRVAVFHDRLLAIRSCDHSWPQ